MKITNFLTPLSLIALALAAAQPEEKRQILSFLTSVAGDATSVVDSVVSEATSAVESVFSEATSVGASVFSDVTSAVVSVESEVTSFGGKIYTEITAIGGELLTLAEGGAGKVTTIGGSVYTVATAAATGTSSGNAAVANVHLFHISAPLLTALAATAGGVIIGAWATL